MKSKKILLDKIQKLRVSLADDGNHAENYFIEIMSKIENEENDKNLLAILHELKSSAAISDYASFTRKQDELFDDIYNEVYSLISEIQVADIN